MQTVTTISPGRSPVPAHPVLLQDFALTFQQNGYVAEPAEPQAAEQHLILQSYHPNCKGGNKIATQWPWITMVVIQDHGINPVVGEPWIILVVLWADSSKVLWLAMDNQSKHGWSTTLINTSSAYLMISCSQSPRSWLLLITCSW